MITYSGNSNQKELTSILNKDRKINEKIEKNVFYNIYTEDLAYNRYIQKSVAIPNEANKI